MGGVILKSTLRTAFTTNQYNDEPFRRVRVIENINRLHLAVKMYIFIISWFMIVNLVNLLFRQHEVETMYLYLIVYGLFIIMNLIYLIAFRPDKFRRSSRPDVVEYYEKVVLSYILISMVLGSAISIIDMIQYEHVMVFMMNMIICSSFFLTTSRQIIIPIIVSTVIIIIGLFVIDTYEDMLYKSSFYNIALFVPIAIFASRVLYNAYCESYATNLRLKQEKETNQLLNQHLKEANRQLEIQASLDELTNIANRRGFDHYLDKLQKTYKDQPFDMSIIMMDVDHFKSFNDYYGHSPGDDALASIAKALRSVAEETDGFVARWGGEEFIYAAHGKSPEQIVTICQRVQSAIQALKIPHVHSGISDYVTLSLGATTAKVVGKEDVQTCIMSADKTLYSVKIEGRNGFKYYV